MELVHASRSYAAIPLSPNPSLSFSPNLSLSLALNLNLNPDSDPTNATKPGRFLSDPPGLVTLP
jgi:hypothetical protein